MTSWLPHSLNGLNLNLKNRTTTNEILQLKGNIYYDFTNPPLLLLTSTTDQSILSKLRGNILPIIVGSNNSNNNN